MMPKKNSINDNDFFLVNFIVMIDILYKVSRVEVGPLPLAETFFLLKTTQL